MAIKQIKEKHWENVYKHITKYGKSTPLSLQFDIDINCNRVDYIVKVQPAKNRKIIALQAMEVYPDSGDTGGRGYHLIEDNAMLSALLEIIIYQAT